MPKQENLQYIINLLEKDDVFKKSALELMEDFDPLLTYPQKSIVSRILNYWMLTNQLPFYDCGEELNGYDFENTEIYCDKDGNYDRAIAALFNSWQIKIKDLNEKIKSSGFEQPLSLIQE